MADTESIGGSCEGDSKSRDELWVEVLGLIQIFSTNSDESNATDEMIAAEMAGERLYEIDMSTIEDDLCVLLIKACVAHLATSQNMPCCLLSLSIICNIVEEDCTRGNMVLSCNEFLPLVFGQDALLMDASYLARAFNVTWVLLSLHISSQNSRAPDYIDETCTLCECQAERCLCYALLRRDFKRCELVAIMTGVLCMVLEQSVNADLLTRAWALSSLLLGEAFYALRSCFYRNNDA